MNEHNPGSHAGGVRRGCAVQGAFLHTVNSRLFPSASPQQLDEVEAAIAGRMSASVAAAYTTLSLSAMSVSMPDA